MQTPAADAWSAGRLHAALARPSTMSRRQFLVLLTLPAQSRVEYCAEMYHASQYSTLRISHGLTEQNSVVSFKHAMADTGGKRSF